MLTLAGAAMVGRILAGTVSDVKTETAKDYFAAIFIEVGDDVAQCRLLR